MKKYAGVTMACVLAAKLAAGAQDGALDTTYVTENSGYSSNAYASHGLAGIYVPQASKDGIANANAFLKKSDGSALLVGPVVDTVNHVTGLGVLGLDQYGNPGYQPQCTDVFHTCYADGAALGATSAYSFKTVAATLTGDSGAIVAVGSLLNQAATLFVAKIDDANDTLNFPSFFSRTEFSDNVSLNYTATSAIQPAPDTIFIAGSAQISGSDTDFFVAKLIVPPQQNWTPDTTFGDHGMMRFGFNIGGDKHDVANALAIDADGNILVIGTVATSTDNTQVGLMRLKPNGTLDGSFGIFGAEAFDFFDGAYAAARSFGNAVALRDDGSVIIGGAAFRFAQGAVTAEQFAAVTRLGHNGGIIGSSTFGPNTPATDNAQLAGDGATILFHYFEDFESLSDVRAITIQRNGRILLAGTAGRGSFEYFGISRLEKNGNPDTTFSHLPNSGFKDSTRTYSFQNGLDSYTIPFGTTQSNQDYASGILSTPEGIYVYGTSTAVTTNNQDFGYIRLVNHDAIFADNFDVLPPGG